MKKLFIFIIIILASYSISFSQTRSAGGVVTDQKTKKPMVYISVYFKNTASGCVTIYRGEFYVQDKSGADTLVVDAIGYEKQFIKRGWQRLSVISRALIIIIVLVLKI